MKKLWKRGKFWLYIVIALIIGIILGVLFSDFVRSIIGYVIGSAGKAAW
jgi:undecaprenyl pyrophosphate phosphatase UppP